MLAEAGTLHMTAATVATLAIPAIKVIFFIADPSNDLSLSFGRLSLPYPVISLVNSWVQFCHSCCSVQAGQRSLEGRISKPLALRERDETYPSEIVFRITR